MNAPARRPPPWLFGILVLPFGISAAFCSATMGRILSKNGLPQDLIGGIVGLSVAMAALQFLVSPIIDIKLRRRSWLLAVSLVSAALLVGATYMKLPERKWSFVALVMVAQLVASLGGSCNGGLMATMLTPEERASASGWYNAGNVGGGCIGAGLTLWMLGAGHSVQLIGWATGAMMVLPALAVFAVEEAPPPARAIGETFRKTGRNLWKTLRTHIGWTGVIICCSPVGTAAGINLFSSGETSHPYFLGSTQAVEDWTVTLSAGFGGGIILALGALLGGWICKRMRGRTAYLLAGASTILCSVAMGLAPFRPVSYIVGGVLYYFASGLCYGTFTAMVLEVVGDEDDGASTRYTLYTAAANIAIFYVTLLDGRGQTLFETHVNKAEGPRGLLLTDALLNLVGIGVLLLLFRLFRPRKPLTITTTDPLTAAK